MGARRPPPGPPVRQPAPAPHAGYAPATGKTRKGSQWRDLPLFRRKGRVSHRFGLPAHLFVSAVNPQNFHGRAAAGRGPGFPISLSPFFVWLPSPNFKVSRKGANTTFFRSEGRTAQPAAEPCCSLFSRPGQPPGAQEGTPGLGIPARRPAPGAGIGPRPPGPSRGPQDRGLHPSQSPSQRPGPRASGAGPPGPAHGSQSCEPGPRTQDPNPDQEPGPRTPNPGLKTPDSAPNPGPWARTLDPRPMTQGPRPLPRSRDSGPQSSAHPGRRPQGPRQPRPTDPTGGGVGAGRPAGTGRAGAAALTSAPRPA